MPNRRKFDHIGNARDEDAGELEPVVSRADWDKMSYPARDLEGGPNEWATFPSSVHADDGPSTLLLGRQQADPDLGVSLEPLAAFGVTVDGQLRSDDFEHDGALVDQDLDQPDMA